MKILTANCENLNYFIGCIVCTAKSWWCGMLIYFICFIWRPFRYGSFFAWSWSWSRAQNRWDAHGADGGLHGKYLCLSCSLLGETGMPEVIKQSEPWITSCFGAASEFVCCYCKKNAYCSSHQLLSLTAHREKILSFLGGWCGVLNAPCVKFRVSNLQCSDVVQITSLGFCFGFFLVCFPPLFL